MDILRFITAGNVDDGKSTLIGRLLYDTGNIKTDVLEAVTGDDDINLAHITDGLRSERTQGITIDVAYKYFTTPTRKYIIVDAPGHFQFTKNLVTGASAADAMIILIDAHNGITEQTRRHSLVASFLKTNSIIVVVNKMDAVGFSEATFNAVETGFRSIAEKLHLPEITYIPASALNGDNVTKPSANMDWYKGRTLMQCLSECVPTRITNDVMRLSVQYVANDGQTQYCAGKLLSGSIKTGDTISVFPENRTAIVHTLTVGGHSHEVASAGQSVCLSTTNQLSIKRGDLITGDGDTPRIGQHLSASVCWLDDTPLQTGKEYILRINSKSVTCRITGITSKTNVNTFEQYNGAEKLAVNEFANVTIATDEDVCYDSFSHIPANGRGTIVDPATNYTSGAFVID